MFHEYFPEVAKRETRSFTYFVDSKLPAGNYSLLEMYCKKPGCDCRRVFFSVISSVTKRIEAVIAYGWDSDLFYANWFGDDDPDIIRELKGPVLNLSSPQSSLAPAILKVVKNVVLQDQAYIQRLKAHYKMFKDVIDKKPKRRLLRRKKKGIKTEST